jgi:hypothetical protein
MWLPQSIVVLKPLQDSAKSEPSVSEQIPTAQSLHVSLRGIARSHSEFFVILFCCQSLPPKMMGHPLKASGAKKRAASIAWISSGSLTGEVFGYYLAGPGYMHFICLARRSIFPPKVRSKQQTQHRESISQVPRSAPLTEAWC